MRVLVTGGGHGIGFKTVEYLLQEPQVAVLVFTLNSSLELRQLLTKHSTRLVVKHGDVTSHTDTCAAVALMVEQFGGIDALICSAGIEGPFHRIVDMPYDHFQRVVNVNLCGTFLSVRECIPYLRETRGKIIILSSTADKAVYAGRSAYGCSKSALTRFIQSLVWEEQENGIISVYGIYPGLTKTPMAEELLEGKYDHVMLPSEAARYRKWIEDGAVEPPDYCAEAIVRLALGQAEGEKGHTASYSIHVPELKKGYW